MKKSRRQFIYLSFLLVLALIISSCSPLTKNEETVTVEPSAFHKDIEYLEGRGIKLPSLSSDSKVKMDQFLSLLVETYESLGHEIDISKFNPRNPYSKELKKLISIRTYNVHWNYDELTSEDLDYSLAAHFLMSLQDSIQERLYWRSDYNARLGDLLSRINVSTGLYTWSEDKEKVKTYSLIDLLDGEFSLDQELNRLLLAEMMVKVYEDIVGEIQIDESQKLKDTDNIYATKSHHYFLWTEDGNFDPLRTGQWDDWDFITAINFDSSLAIALDLDREKVPYGALVSALSTLLRQYEGTEQNLIEEKIVLNERSYDWHVNQYQSGLYSDMNCMPASVEMSMRYQGLTNVPTTEELRNEYQVDGLGWTDVLAENVMSKYGLKFDFTFDVELDEMIEYLDEGNVLYVMFNEFDNEIGHAGIIKGYWKLGEKIDFIVSDPGYDMIGPFGYIEYTIDAQTMIHNMRIHLPKYFIISPEEL